MITKLQKIFAATGLSALIAGSVLAGSFSHVINSNSSYSGVASVPTAATCQQFAAAYWYGPPPSGSFTTCNGPFGNYYLVGGSPNNSIYFNGPIAAGNYNVYLYTNPGGSGYAGVTINW